MCHNFNFNCIFCLLQVYQGTGVQIATDLSVVAACETLIDAVNMTGGGGMYMHSPMDYAEIGSRYSELDSDYAYDDELRSVQMQTTSMREQSSANSAQPTKPTVQLRTFFPENWLFDIQESSDGIIDR